MKNIIAIALLMTAFAAQASPSFSNKEPRSYEEFLGKDPHPTWVKNEVTPMSDITDSVLPNIAFKQQEHTNGSAQPSPCSNYFGINPVTLDEITVVPTTTTVGIGFSSQPSIPEGNGFAGVSLICSVTQEGITRACSGIANEPVMLQRIKQSQYSAPNAWRSSNVILSGYHGFVTGLEPGKPATVNISARTFSVPAGATGQVCYGSMEVSY